MNGFWNTAAIAVVCSVSAPVAHATSFDFLAQGSDVLVGNDPGEISTLLSADANKASPDGQIVDTLYTAAIRMQGRVSDSGDIWNDYTAFCIQIDQSLNLPAAGNDPNTSYTLTQDHLTEGRRDMLATLFANAFDAFGDASYQAAFQLAVWNLVHSDDGAVFDLTADKTENLQRGYYNFDKAPDDSDLTAGFRLAHPETWALAEGFLEGLDGDGIGDWESVDYAASNLSIFVSPTSQNLIALGEGDPVEVPVMPVPAGLPLVLSGLGALAFLRRRARQRGSAARAARIPRAGVASTRR